jgi:hypothetical protein
MKLFVLLVAVLGGHGGECQMYKKVKLKDVEVLTLYKGRMTNGRRSSPVQQLSCRGGTAGCSAFVPEVVQCTNRGSDGYDIQWECKADMDNAYRFGQISVGCEGYDYPDDPYILAGSCGLDYTIDLTEEGKERAQKSGGGSQNSQNSYNNNYYSGKNSTEDSDYSWLAILIIVGIIYYVITNTGHEDHAGIPPAGTMGPDGVPPPAGSPPPYTPDAPYSSARRPGEQGWRPGFWSGFGLGNLTGGWWGGNRNRGYNRGWGGWGGSRYGYRSGGWGNSNAAYNEGFTDGARNRGSSSPNRRSSPSSSPSSSGTRTASGFGGTTRR